MNRTAFIRKRPQKVAFIVSGKNNNEEVNKVFTYNVGKWGGRYNLIVLINDEIINDADWTILSQIDPDIIRSLVTLNSDCIKKINTKLTPYYVDDSSLGHTLTVNGPIGIHLRPTINQIRDISTAIFTDPVLILFKTLNSCLDQNIIDFISRNFGICDHLYNDTGFLPTQNKINISIENKGNFIEALGLLSSLENAMFPVQMCALPDSLNDIETDFTRGQFAIIIGDDVKDSIYAWNRGIFQNNYRRKHLNQIWIPKAFIYDEDVMPALNSLITKIITQNWYNNNEVQVESCSIDNTELNEINKLLLPENNKYSKVCRTLSYNEHPSIASHVSEYYFERQNNEIHKLLDENKNTIRLYETPVDDLSHMVGNYVAELIINYRSEIETYYLNKESWLKLPARNAIACRMLGGDSRITLSGYPAVAVDVRNPTIEITLLNDHELLKDLASYIYRPRYRDDARHRIIEENTYTVKRSSNGKYFLGIVGLAKGLDKTYHIFKERYWQKIFKVMMKMERTESRKQEIRNKLVKIIKNNPFADIDNNYIVSKLIDISKDLAIVSEEIPFIHFRRLAWEELREFNEKYEGHDFIPDKQLLKEYIEDLTESRILIPGYKSHCSACGFSNWHEVGELDAILRCKGCSKSFIIKPDQQLYYRLNTLVQNCIYDQGLLTMILVLGQLEEQSRYSFHYTCSLDIFQSYEEKAITDIDVVCISDGEFIIGEVKNSYNKFDQEKFNTMKEVAIRIRPDKVIFSTLDEKPPEPFMRKIDCLRKDLSAHNIDVQWYGLNSDVFQPSVFFHKH
jgi:hypothetical protein